MLQQFVNLANYTRQSSRLVANYVIRETLHTTRALPKRAKGKQHGDADSDEEKDATFEDEFADKHYKVLDAKVTNLRLDAILKAGLGLARNKIEVKFYESRIRVNGCKVFKKSDAISEGDEIDIIKGHSPSNPQLLNVARVEVLVVTPKDEFIALKLRRCKSLLIENYKDAWKGSSSE